MEGCCSFKAIVGGVCGYNTTDRKRKSEVVALRLSCIKDINNDKFTKLILYRAAKLSKKKKVYGP